MNSSAGKTRYFWKNCNVHFVTDILFLAFLRFLLKYKIVTTFSDHSRDSMKHTIFRYSRILLTLKRFCCTFPVAAVCYIFSAFWIFWTLYMDSENLMNCTVHTWHMGQLYRVFTARRDRWMETTHDLWARAWCGWGAWIYACAMALRATPDGLCASSRGETKRWDLLVQTDAHAMAHKGGYGLTLHE